MNVRNNVDESTANGLNSIKAIQCLNSEELDCLELFRCLLEQDQFTALDFMNKLLDESIEKYKAIANDKRVIN